MLQKHEERLRQALEQAEHQQSKVAPEVEELRRALQEQTERAEDGAAAVSSGFFMGFSKVFIGFHGFLAGFACFSRVFDAFWRVLEWPGA